MFPPQEAFVQSALPQWKEETRTTHCAQLLTQERFRRGWVFMTPPQALVMSIMGAFPPILLCFSICPSNALSVYLRQLGEKCLPYVFTYIPESPF